MSLTTVLHLSLALILLFLMANVAAALYVGRAPAFSRWEAIKRDHRRRANKVIAEHGMPFFHRLYPGRTDHEIRKLIHAQKAFRTAYYPFVETRAAAVVDPTICVHAAGFRFVGADQGPWPIDPAAFNVFVFGSSITLALALRDDETVPAVAQRIMRERTGRRDICFYNFSTSGHFSTQEAIYLQNLLRDGARPDMVVMIDGPNEFHYWHGESALSARHRDVDAEIDGLRRQLGRERGVGWHLVELAASLPVVRLYRMLKAHKRPPTSEPGETRINLPAADPGGDIYDLLYDDPPAITDRKRIDRVVERYFVNKSITEGVAHGFGIEPVFVWQPTPVYKYDLRFGAYEIPPDQRRSRYGYPVLRERAEHIGAGANFLWCADIFETSREPMYCDHVHYNEAGCEALARHIVEGLLTTGAFERALARKTRRNLTLPGSTLEAPDGRNEVIRIVGPLFGENVKASQLPETPSATQLAEIDGKGVRLAGDPHGAASIFEDFRIEEVPPMALYEASVRLRPGTSRRVLFALHFMGTETKSSTVQIDLGTMSCVAGSGLYSLEPGPGDWHTATLAARPGTGSISARVQLYPSFGNAAGEGDVIFGGGELRVRRTPSD